MTELNFNEVHLASSQAAADHSPAKYFMQKIRELKRFVYSDLANIPLPEGLTWSSYNLKDFLDDLTRIGILKLEFGTYALVE